MAAEAAELSDGHMVRNVVLFSVLVYELVGPTLTKLALTAAGETFPRAAPMPVWPTSPSSRSPSTKSAYDKRHSELLRSAVYCIFWSNYML